MTSDEDEGVAEDQDATIVLGPDDGQGDGRIGQEISHYRILGKVGQGGMGVVYKAEDTRLERTVALKFLPPELVRDDQARERFLREARAASSLDHSNICTVHQFDDVEGESFIAMGYVEGQSLRELVRFGPMPVDEVVDLGAQVARGLVAAHEKGIVHRDIKPANIMLAADGQAKILDFGLATAPALDKLTKVGTTMGTIAYMSPEQARGDTVGPQSDVWSLGVVLYEMIAGRMPFPGDHEQTVIHGILNAEPRSLDDLEPRIDADLRAIIHRALQKDCAERYATAQDLLADLERLGRRLRGEGAPVAGPIWRKPAFVVPIVLVALTATALVAWLLRSQGQLREAQASLVEIERLLEEATGADRVEPLLAAFALAEQVEVVIPEDPRLTEVWPRLASSIHVTSEPPGAEVFIKPYGAEEGEWVSLGVTPLDARLARVYYNWRFQKEGHETVLAAADARWEKLNRTLDPAGTVPEGMVRVEALDLGDETFPSFFIDRYEVTNREFKAFVDAGGYDSRDHWVHPFEQGGDRGPDLSWEAAMERFVDATGRPGPAIWINGDYPDGEENHPVGGVSWYEAAAYAEFVGKDLATTAHWAFAAGQLETQQYRSLAPLLLGQSNLQREDSEAAPVGEFAGLTVYGAYDMAGNVREWTWETTPVGRSTCGGAWDDVYYQFNNVSQLPPFDRSAKNGFRLIVETDRDAVPEWAWEGYTEPEVDYRSETPVSDELFESYLNRFAYDPGALDSEIESRDESHDDWIVERVTFNAAYGNERMVIYLMLPKSRAAPPYQTVLFFPHSGAVLEDTFDLDSWRRAYEPILKSGRAFVFPILRGTYERDLDGFDSAGHAPAPERRHEYTDYMVRWTKDFRRTIDYLEDRDDIDADRLAYLGSSWGAGNPASVVLAVETRFKASMLLVGGFSVSRPLPEVDPFNYAPRVRVPTLMLGGKYDLVFDAETQVRPMFDLLDLPDEDKRLVLYESDHRVPRNESTREMLDWLDRYLGEVR